MSLENYKFIILYRRELKTCNLWKIHICKMANSVRLNLINPTAERDISKPSHYSALDGARPRKSWRPSVRAKNPQFLSLLTSPRQWQDDDKKKIIIISSGITLKIFSRGEELLLFCKRTLRDKMHHPYYAIVRCYELYSFLLGSTWMLINLRPW